MIKFAVRSGSVWSSAGEHGVGLGIRLGDGQPRGPARKIPLVHNPGDVHYMAVELDARRIGTATHAGIALLQGRDDWWEGGLTVSLVPQRMTAP